MNGWFATSVLGPDQMHNPTWAGLTDAFLVHAKKAGTGLTACGRDATTWYKHWLPFDSIRVRNPCGDCLATIAKAARPAAN